MWNLNKTLDNFWNNHIFSKVAGRLLPNQKQNNYKITASKMRDLIQRIRNKTQSPKQRTENDNEMAIFDSSACLYNTFIEQKKTKKNKDKLSRRSIKNRVRVKNKDFDKNELEDNKYAKEEGNTDKLKIASPFLIRYTTDRPSQLMIVGNDVHDLQNKSEIVERNSNIRK